MRKSNYLWLLLVAVLLLPAQEMAAKKKKEKEVAQKFGIQYTRLILLCYIIRCLSCPST